MHLCIIRVSERCRLGIWFLASDGRVGALPAKRSYSATHRLRGSELLVQLDQLIQPLQTGCPSAFVLNTASGFLRSLSIVGQRATGNCDGSSGTPTGTEGATPAERCAAEEGRQKVEPV